MCVLQNPDNIIEACFCRNPFYCTCVDNRPLLVLTPERQAEADQELDIVFPIPPSLKRIPEREAGGVQPATL
jgi:hypothetical protein